MRANGASKRARKLEEGKPKDGELELSLILDGKRQTTVEEEIFLKQAREATGVHRLVLKNETKNYDYWPRNARVLDLSKLECCDTLVIENSFYHVVVPASLEVLEYMGCLNDVLPDEVLPDLRRLAVSIASSLPEKYFLSNHYPNVEVIEFHPTEEAYTFDDLVEDVKALEIANFNCLQQIKVICGKKIFTREVKKQRFTKKTKLVEEPVYDPVTYQRAMREWRQLQDPDISNCKTREECVKEMFMFYSDAEKCSHWFILCPELRLLAEYTVESEARKALAGILDEMKIDPKKCKDLGNRLTFVGWHSNEEEDKQLVQIQESRQPKGSDIRLNLLSAGKVFGTNMLPDSVGWSLWHLYYNTPFLATMPTQLGMATFKMYQDADLPGLFEGQKLLYNSFSQYRNVAAVHLLPRGKVFAAKFQVDKDQELWAEHWFWHILKDSNMHLRDALLDTKDTKLWFDGERCVGLENVRRKIALSLSK